MSFESNNFKNLSAEEAFRRRSKGGVTQGINSRKKKNLKELLVMLSGTPITDKTIKKELEKKGIDSEDMTEAMAIALSIINACKQGSSQMVQIYLNTTGESKESALIEKSNNFLDALLGNTSEDLNIDDIPELQHTSKDDNDVVESENI